MATPEEKAAAKAAKDAEKAAAKADATSATVYAKTGGLMRVYDEETHGSDFEALAQEFSTHNEGSTIVLA